MRKWDKTKTTSKYHGVSHSPNVKSSAATMRYRKKYPWRFCIIYNGMQASKWFATEREAAIAYDRFVLEHGLDKPLNILKPQHAA